jgi:glycosyltransferase involved in cell wall biosynthesis
VKSANNQDLEIAVIVPCYEVEHHIKDVILSIPEFIDHIFVVDDASPDNSSEEVKSLQIDKLIYLSHSENKGVGGAMKTGFQEAVKLGADIMVKIDGDGQMDPTRIQDFIEPIIQGRADYAKGNRFLHIKQLTQMPFIRRFGNIGLAFLVRAASGYWEIFDPSNGYIAIKTSIWNQLDEEIIADDYYFETSMLIELGKVKARIEDVPIPAKYEDEKSNLSISSIISTFPLRLLKAFLYRIYLEYFVLDFNFGSLSLAGGIPLLLFGGIWSIVHWSISAKTNEPATTGTVIIGLLPIILGFQLLMQFFTFDINKRK